MKSINQSQLEALERILRQENDPTKWRRLSRLHTELRGLKALLADQGLLKKIHNTREEIARRYWLCSKDIKALESEIYCSSRELL